LDNEEIYTDEELAAFEKQYEELKRQQAEVCVSSHISMVLLCIELASL